MRRFLSLGAGVQSTTLLLMALEGTFAEGLEGALFADTGWEPPAVYRHLEWLTDRIAPFPIHTVSVGNLREDTLAHRLPSAADSEKGFLTMPVFSKRNGIVSMLRRQCTSEYKLKPLYRKLRELAGRDRVEFWIGISLDEVFRAKPARVLWLTNRWPLIEKRLTRQDCLLWLKRHGYPTPPKSACIGCPFHDNVTWRSMKKEEPDTFAAAVAFDQAIRRHPRLEGENFLHPSAIPLDAVDFSTEEDRGQLNLFNNECEGLCGV